MLPTPLHAQAIYRENSMHTSSSRRDIFAAFVLVFFVTASSLFAQSAGNSGTIYGTVTDATGAIIPNATVSIQNPVSGYGSHTQTDAAGHYQFTNLPLNPYHLTISAQGFSSACLLYTSDA